MKQFRFSFAVLAMVLFTLIGCQEEKNMGDIAGPESENDELLKGMSGDVFTLSNDPADNSVLLFTRDKDGMLSLTGSFSAGGTGTGMGLGSQGALALSMDKRWLYCVNAGSNEISVFKVDFHSLTLINKVSSNGIMPISLTVYHNLLYVVNAGGDGSIAGFTISNDGSLTPIANSIRPLSSSAAGPAQISFNSNGNVLVVTEKMTNMITTYVVDGSGAAGVPNSFPSAGVTPFGFEFNKRGYLIVSEASGGMPGASTTSSYWVDNSGNVSLISGPIPNFQTAACWVATTKFGYEAYITNTGSHNVSGYSIEKNGTLMLFPDGGVTAPSGMGPIDADFDRYSDFLYVLNAVSHDISIFKRNSDGTLLPLGSIGGLPPAAAGLAAR